MLTHRTLVNATIILGITFHFIFFFAYYGPPNSIYDWSYFIAWAVVFSLVVIYLFTVWKSDISSTAVIILYKLFLLLILISFGRSLLTVTGIKEFKWLLFDSYTGLAFFPALFFIIGVNSKNFSSINKILMIYCLLAFACSLFFIKSADELAVFLLMPIFYVIVTYPIQKSNERLLTLIISVAVIFISLTHRAGVMRIIISYCIVLVYFIILNVKINKAILYLIVFCIMILPFYFLFQGIMGGDSIFEKIFSDSPAEYSQENLMIDTRTFLYAEVFQDLKMSNALPLGKGVAGGYASMSFQTMNRQIVEVGFLQMLLKSGIIGFLVYLTLLFSAVFKALGKSKSLFMKCLGILLASYLLMFFVENVIAFDLLNIVIWLVIGMCHSKELLGLTDNEIRQLYHSGRVDAVKAVNKMTGDEQAASAAYPFKMRQSKRPS